MKTKTILCLILLSSLSFFNLYSQSEKDFEKALKQAVIQGLVNSITGEENPQADPQSYGASDFQGLTLTIKTNDGNIITCKQCIIDGNNNQGIRILPSNAQENITYDPKRILRFVSYGPDVQRYSSHVTGDVYLNNGQILRNVSINFISPLKGIITGFNTTLATDYKINGTYFVANDRIKLIDEITFDWY